jgi:RNA 2',3'-cyclic 3'-phosphodiesterase
LPRERNAVVDSGALRLFFAVVPDAGARRSLAALAHDVARAAGGRPPRDANLHLTLAFVGSVPAGRVVQIEAIGARAAAAVPPFLLTLDGVGLFREAAVAWAGPDRIPPELQLMFDTLRDGLQASRLPFERRAFHPHVTLARHCARPLSGMAMAPVEWWVGAVALIASDTLPEGPRYREIASWRLNETNSRGDHEELST